MYADNLKKNYSITQQKFKFWFGCDIVKLTNYNMDREKR